jgi:metal-dependent hydrolase (beta-lactamase superfamily II)
MHIPMCLISGALRKSRLSQATLRNAWKAFFNTPLGIETTWTAHCTGEAAFEVLRGAMGNRVQEIHTGSRIDL